MRPERIKSARKHRGLTQVELAKRIGVTQSLIREWTVFIRYPSWVIALFIWPVIFPMGYILTARALSGVDGSGLATFQNSTGLTEYVGFIAVGTMIWMWQNIVLWAVGYALRNEQMRGTLESNWLSPTWRFSYLLGSSIPQMVSMLILMLVAGLEYAFLFRVDFNGSLWLTLLVILSAIPSVYGLGFAFASLVITLKEANAFVFLVRGGPRIRPRRSSRRRDSAACSSTPRWSDGSTRRRRDRPVGENQMSFIQGFQVREGLTRAHDLSCSAPSGRPMGSLSSSRS